MAWHGNGSGQSHVIYRGPFSRGPDFGTNRGPASGVHLRPYVHEVCEGEGEGRKTINPPINPPPSPTIARYYRRYYVTDSRSNSRPCINGVQAARARRTSSRRIRSNGCRCHPRRIALPLTLPCCGGGSGRCCCCVRFRNPKPYRAACTSGFVTYSIQDGDSTNVLCTVFTLVDRSASLMIQTITSASVVFKQKRCKPTTTHTPMLRWYERKRIVRRSAAGFCYVDRHHSCASRTRSAKG